MRSGGNSFYYIVFGALLVILAFALMTTIPSWREIMLGPAPRRDLQAANAETLTAGGLASPGGAAADKQAAAEPSPEPPRPMAEPGKPRESAQVADTGRPSGLFQQEASYRFGGIGETRPIYQAPKPSYGGPMTGVDAVVYNKPNGDPLPAPSLTNTALVLIRGTHVRISERSGAWLKIITPAGQKGWVEVRDVINLPAAYRQG
ncbi:hypothetical protein IT575_02285 [bacterium]|nr:hypothetical protein [bacterium]